MGYRSDVRISMKKENYVLFSNYVKDYLEEYLSKYGNLNGYENTFEANILNHTDVKQENESEIYVGWNYMKWYEDDFPEIAAIMYGLNQLDQKGKNYNYARIGEDIGDIETVFQEYEMELYPIIIQGFSDSGM